MRPMQLSIFVCWFYMAILSLAACSEKKGAEKPAGTESRIYIDSFVVVLLSMQNVFAQSPGLKPETFALEAIGKETNPYARGAKAQQ